MLRVNSSWFQNIRVAPIGHAPELETTLSTLIDERNAEVINALGLISETLDTVLRKVRQIDTAVEDLASA